MTLIGIDPGKSGGIAWSHDGGPVAVVKMPEGVGDIADVLRDTLKEGGGPSATWRR